MASFAAEQALVQEAAKAAERNRMRTQRATKGWLLWIIPGAALLFAVLAFVVQKATGIPTYDALGLGSCAPAAVATEKTESDALHAQCDERLSSYSSGQRNVARLALLIGVVVIIYFLYDLFQRGAGAALIGGTAGTSPMLQVRPAMRAEAVRQQVDIDTAINAVEQSRAQLPAGATDGSYYASAPPTLSAAGAQQPYVQRGGMAAPGGRAAVEDIARDTGFADWQRGGGGAAATANPFNQGMPIGQ